MKIFRFQWWLLVLKFIGRLAGEEWQWHIGKCRPQIQDPCLKDCLVIAADMFSKDQYRPYDDDKTETISKGDVFYLSAVHNGVSSDEIIWIEFSPGKELQTVFDYLAKE